MKNLQDAGIDNVFFWLNPVEKCTTLFPRCYVAVPFKEPLPAYSRAYFRFQRNNAMNAMETIDGEPCICIQ
jgi:hypothetical protein